MINHINTLVFPAIFAGLSVLLILIPQINPRYKKPRLLKASIMLLFISTMLTGGLGGSKMGYIEKVPGVDTSSLSLHAWLGAGSCIISIVLLVISLRTAVSETTARRYMILLAGLILFTSLYLLSVISAGFIFPQG